MVVSVVSSKAVEIAVDWKVIKEQVWIWRVLSIFGPGPWARWARWARGPVWGPWLAAVQASLCGEKDISKSKCTKYLCFAALSEVQMSKS